MSDPVTVCNLALGFLGEKSITSFEDASTAAELCAVHYPPAVRAVLEERAWGFATRRGTLENPETSGDFLLYTLPADVLRVLSCSATDWRLERGRKLRTNVGGAVTYSAVFLVEDPKEWSPHFTRCVAARLAADLATPITSNAKLAEAMEVRYLRELRTAGAIDAVQGSSDLVGAAQSALAARRY